MTAPFVTHLRWRPGRSDRIGMKSEGRFDETEPLLATMQRVHGLGR